MKTSSVNSKESQELEKMYELCLRDLSANETSTATDKALELLRSCEQKFGPFHLNTLQWHKALAEDFLQYKHEYALEFALRGKRRAKELFFESHPMVLEFTLLSALFMRQQGQIEEGNSLFHWLSLEMLRSPYFSTRYRHFVQMFIDNMGGALSKELQESVLNWAQDYSLIDTQHQVSTLIDNLRKTATNDLMESYNEILSMIDDQSCDEIVPIFKKLRDFAQECSSAELFERVVTWGLDKLASLDMAKSTLALECHLDLCKLYVDINETELAMVSFNTAIKLLDELQGQDQGDLSGTSRALGEIAYAFGRLEESRQLLTNALHELIKKNPESPEAADTLHNLGTLLLAQGEYSEAQPYLEYAVSLKRQFLPSTSTELGKSLYALGKLYILSGSIEKSVSTLTEAENIFSASETYPEGFSRDIENARAKQSSMNSKSKQVSTTNRSLPNEQTEVIELEHVAMDPDSMPQGLKCTKKNKSSVQNQKDRKDDPLRAALLMVQRGKVNEGAELLEKLFQDERSEDDNSRKLLILENLISAYESLGDGTNTEKYKQLIDSLGSR